VELSAKIEARTSVAIKVRLIGPNGEIVQNEGPTEDQITYKLARDNEPLRRALVIYGSLEHTWANLYKVLDEIRDGNGGLAGLKAKNFFSSSGNRKLHGHGEQPLRYRIGVMTGRDKGVTEPRMALQEAQEMFRKLLDCWITELKDKERPSQAATTATEWKRTKATLRFACSTTAKPMVARRAMFQSGRLR
jgi:hypothetical protein